MKIRVDWEDLDAVATIPTIAATFFIAERILSKKTEGKSTYYLTQWKGFDAKDATWETKHSIRNAKLVRDFNRLWEAEQKLCAQEEGRSWYKTLTERS